MGKRAADLIHRQWQHYADHHRHPANLALHMLAVPLFVISSLVLLRGLLRLDFLSLVLAALGLLAALVLQAQGHQYEVHPEQGQPDTSLQHLLAEQFLTFPRFVLSGAWWRAWKARHRHRK